MTNYFPIEDLIEEAKNRGIQTSDIFEFGRSFVSSEAFLDKMLENTQEFFKTATFDRILSSKPGDEFYDVLINFLDSEGTGKTNYKKLSPVQARDTYNLEPLDGRHRAAFATLLGIKYIPMEKVR